MNHYDFGSEWVDRPVGRKRGNSKKINAFREIGYKERNWIGGKENFLNYRLSQAVVKRYLKIPGIEALCGLDEYLLVGRIWIYHKLRC